MKGQLCWFRNSGNPEHEGEIYYHKCRVSRSPWPAVSLCQWEQNVKHSLKIQCRDTQLIIGKDCLLEGLKHCKLGYCKRLSNHLSCSLFQNAIVSNHFCLESRSWARWPLELPPDLRFLLLWSLTGLSFLPYPPKSNLKNNLCKKKCYQRGKMSVPK